VFVPGALLVVVTYIAAHQVLSHSIAPGKLVTFYAYAAFLILPVQTLIETATRWSAATVAAGRVLGVLRQSPDLPRHPSPAAEPPRGALVDGISGLVVEPGRLTVVASSDPVAASQLADRLGRYVDTPGDVVQLAGTPLAHLPLEVVRRRVLVVDREPQILAGTLAEAVDMPPFGPEGTGRARPTVRQAIEAAGARDVLDGLAEGIDTELPERGRTLSGGQRQRIVLAAALRADPDILVLDEPTSAVDAHTEAAVAVSLHRLRTGRTTVVISTSPFLLEHADVVVFLDGHVRAQGGHHDLLQREPGYRRLVTRV
jgi:ABC-type multidrug transport system fused ATPase/permease subunit